MRDAEHTDPRTVRLVGLEEKLLVTGEVLR